MCEAARAGCLETILHLSRSTADGDYNGAEALKSAVASGRRDIALAIIMGNRPPRQPALDEAFQMVHNNPSLSPSVKLDLAELLLCAGADGLVVSQALEAAFNSQFIEMTALLAAYGASVHYNDAAVLKSAVAQGQLHLVESLLRHGDNTLTPALASSCVPLINNQSSFEQRHASLSLLLAHGANGIALDDILIDVVKAGDTKSLCLLLNPNFPALPHSSSSFDRGRHEIASVDHRSGEALQTAVLRGDIDMTQRLLAQRPSHQTLSTVFPLTMQLLDTKRYRMVQIFLENPLPASCLHVALHDAITEHASQADKSLIELLLSYDADVNYEQGSALACLIKQHDMDLVEKLLKKASPQTAAARLLDVMHVPDSRLRYDMMCLLFNAGAANGKLEVATALAQLLSEDSIDMPLLKLLLRQGRADLDLLEAGSVQKAAANPDPEVLEVIIEQGSASGSFISRTFEELAPLASTEGKAQKLKMLLSVSARKEDINTTLVHEVQSVVKGSSETACFAPLKLLLAAGADPSAHQAAALCHAVNASRLELVDLLLSCAASPKPPALAIALPHALRVTEPKVRQKLAQRLVQAGTMLIEVNRALKYAISALAGDMALIGALAAGADDSDGSALSLSVSVESAEVTKLLLAKSGPTLEARSASLARAVRISDRSVRIEMCKILLASGVSEESATDALMFAAHEGDVELGDMLIANGACIASNGGQAIVEACRGGSSDVLKVLLKATEEARAETITAAFQAAADIGDIGERAAIFRQLLPKGACGPAVDAQLELTVAHGDSGQALLRDLLFWGADPNYNNGESVVLAARSAHVQELELLLNISPTKSPILEDTPMELKPRKQKRPSQSTLVRALKASFGVDRKSRHLVVCALFKAGLRASDELHTALNDAVNEESPDRRLIEQLLLHGASPSAQGCKTLIDAARTMSAQVLGLMLQQSPSQEDMSTTFAAVFSVDNFENWFSENGFSIAQLLLRNGVGVDGEVLSPALVLVMARSTPKRMELADEFFYLFLHHDADLNYNNGELLQLATSRANTTWVGELLAQEVSANTLSVAVQRIFDSTLTEDGFLNLFEVFADHHEWENAIDIMVPLPGSEPFLVRAIGKYPRSTAVLAALLNAGFYHDPAFTYQINSETAPEELTLLLWALAQPQKRVSLAVMKLLIENGASVNARSSASGITPLILAVQSKRPDVVNMLLLQGADVDALDVRGRSPLSLATGAGGDVAVQMMTSLLAAKPERDDGSLHNAAKDLNYEAVKVLVQSGHDADFPSPLHAGRSALGEVCLHGSDGGEMTAERERAMQKVMSFLIDSGSDLSLKSDGKSLLHLCLDAVDPVATTRALLRSGMWKHVNKAFNHVVVDGYTYSPTMYISRTMGPSDAHAKLLTVLRASRATDVFYANEGPQPEDAVGLPGDLEARERARKARLARMTEEAEDFSVAMARRREMAGIEQQIAAHKAEMDDARRRKLHGEDIASLRSRAQMEESIASAAQGRRLAEQQALAEASLGRTRALAATELETAEAARRKALEWETRLGAERADNARALSAIRLGERQELERVEHGAEVRMRERLEAQRRLVESQEKLAKRLADGTTAVGGGGGAAAARRQIGYVTELN